MTDDRDDADCLLHEIDEQFELLGCARATAVAEIGRLTAKQAALGYHPNHLGYLFGGAFASRGMGAAHILPLAGWHRLPFAEAIHRLVQAVNGSDGDDDLLTAVRVACESDQRLEAAGFAWLGELGLLKHGEIDRYWLGKPTLGLGQPARMHGLVREHQDGHRGLYALAVPDLRERFAGVDRGNDGATLGDLLLDVVVAGGSALASLGAAAVHQDAKQRYDADGRSFVRHQRATDRRDWRGKPPLSTQGHLARRTANARGIDLAAERTRGGAADWLDETGANVRFRED